MATLAHTACSSAAASGNFLVKPGIGLMVWTLLVFGVTIFLLAQLAFPRIAEALDRASGRSKSRSTRPSARARRPTSCSPNTASA